MSRISHGALCNNSPFLCFLLLLSRFRSLRATCMTVAMTASGARLLLLALCACRGSTLQSAPRVRLPFKGEPARVGPQRLPDAFLRLLPAFFPRRAAVGVSSFRACEDGISCRTSNSATPGTKGGYYVCLGSRRKKKNQKKNPETSPHTQNLTHTPRSGPFYGRHDDTKRKHLKSDDKNDI